jgi:hypothetical protein
MRPIVRFVVAVATVILPGSATVATALCPASAQQYPAPGPPAPLAPPPAYNASPPPPVLGAPPLAPPPVLPPAPSTFASGLQLIAYPYLWLAGLNMAITTPLQRAPQVNVSIGAGEILGDLDNVPFMGAAELRDGPFGVLADALHIPLGVPITTRNIFFSGGNVGVVQSTVTADFLYRVLDQPVQTIDAGLGFRFWGISTDTILNGRAFIPTISVSRSGSWTDPLIAARYHRDFCNGFGLTAYGDVGGFGIAAHADWEITGTLDYTLKPWLDVHLGYRSLNVNYSASRIPLGFNVHEKGPIIAATLRF